MKECALALLWMHSWNVNRPTAFANACACNCLWGLRLHRPGGLQIGHLMNKAGRDYVILEKVNGHMKAYIVSKCTAILAVLQSSLRSFHGFAKPARARISNVHGRR